MDPKTKTWIEYCLAIIGGGVVSVLVDKVLGDILIAGKIPNPEYMPLHVQTHDVVQVVAELSGAYLAQKEGQPLISNFLVGMAGAVVITDAFQTASNIKLFR